MQRTIIHIDMNAFFASVEQQANPQLRDKPIAVVGRGRTVVTTASYEARAFGVKTGMSKWEALRQCPQLILVEGDNRKYTWTSRQIMTILQEYTPQVEVFSIDEAFLDVTGSLALFGSAERIALLIKARIRHRLGLTCSIGIAPNKLLAKLASDMKKPDGLTIIHSGDLPALMERIPIRDLCGIGRQTERALTLCGIRTCGELGRFPMDILRRKFGVIGERLSLMGRGIDHSPVVPSTEEDTVQSVGHSMTLDRDISDPADIRRFLLQLAEMVGRRARRHHVAGKTIHLTIRYADMTTFGRQQTRADHTNASDEIFREALAILETLALEQPVRLLGIRLTNLRQQQQQLSLFAAERRQSKALDAMDAVNDRFGEHVLTFGTILNNGRKGAHVIAPAWRPDGIRSVDVH